MIIHLRVIGAGESLRRVVGLYTIEEIVNTLKIFMHKL